MGTNAKLGSGFPYCGYWEVKYCVFRLVVTSIAGSDPDNECFFFSDAFVLKISAYPMVCLPAGQW